MKVKVMDDERIAISNISDLEDVKLSDLAIATIDRSKTGLYNELLNNGNTLIIPMLSVVYGGAKILVLTARDENFSYLVKKVRDVYQKEKDKPIVGTFFTRYINIDEITKKVLLSDTLDQTSELYRHYSDMDSFTEPLVSKEKEVYGLLPLIEYIIKKNLSNINLNFRLDNKVNGYAPGGNYALYGYINGIYTVIPMIIEREGNNTYKLELGNIFGNFDPLNVTISFKKTSLDIVSKVDTLNYTYLESFAYEEGKVINSSEIYISDKCVYTEPVVYEKENQTPAVSKIDEDDNIDWFRMPWKANLGFGFSETKIDDNSRISYRKVQYIDENKESFINIESAEKRFKRKTQNNLETRDIVFDDVDKTMVGYKDGDIIYIETGFSDDGAVGEYLEKYANRYFYQVSNAIDFDHIDRNNTYPVTREHDVYVPGDLVGNYKIKSIFKGN